MATADRKFAGMPLGKFLEFGFQRCVAGYARLPSEFCATSSASGFMYGLAL